MENILTLFAMWCASQGNPNGMTEKQCQERVLVCHQRRRYDPDDSNNFRECLMSKEFDLHKKPDWVR
jgi:hypothetical protein